MLILAVDDNHVNLQIIAGMLSAGGLTPVEAISAEQALELLVPEGQIELVLMDFRMPGTDGLAATRAIRQRTDATATVPIVIVTADATPDLKASALAAGANYVLCKPLDMSELYDAISKLLVDASPNGVIVD